MLQFGEVLRQVLLGSRIEGDETQAPQLRDQLGHIPLRRLGCLRLHLRCHALVGRSGDGLALRRGDRRESLEDDGDHFVGVRMHHEVG